MLRPPTPSLCRGFDGAGDPSHPSSAPLALLAQSNHCEEPARYRPASAFRRDLPSGNRRVRAVGSTRLDVRWFSTLLGALGFRFSIRKTPPKAVKRL